MTKEVLIRVKRGLGGCGGSLEKSEVITIITKRYYITRALIIFVGSYLKAWRPNPTTTNFTSSSL